MHEKTVLIVGLGNPGLEYKNTRHNIGFLCVDALQKEEVLNPASWKLKKSFKAYIAEASYKTTKIYLIKPQTFMNLSGQSVALLAGFFKVHLDDVWICYDDKDLNLGKLRIRDMGSSGGHNGIKSIADSLGTLSFGRFRIGIATEHLDNIDTSRYVLGRLSSDEKEIILKTVHDKFIKAIYEALKTNLKTAQNNFGE